MNDHEFEAIKAMLKMHIFATANTPTTRPDIIVSAETARAMGYTVGDQGPYAIRADGTIARVVKNHQ